MRNLIEEYDSTFYQMLQAEGEFRKQLIASLDAMDKVITDFLASLD